MADLLDIWLSPKMPIKSKKSPRDSYQNITECVRASLKLLCNFHVSSVNSCGNTYVRTWYITVVNTLQILTILFSIENLAALF